MGFDPHEESGKNRKLSRPWHGPYRIITMTDTDITAIRIYFPEDDSIKVHQGRVTKCPIGSPQVVIGMGIRNGGQDIYLDDSRLCVKSRSQKQDQSNVHPK